MNDYLVKSSHEQDLADARIASPGEVVKLNAEEARDPHNAALIEDGVLELQQQSKAKRADNTDKE